MSYKKIKKSPKNFKLLKHYQMQLVGDLKELNIKKMKYF
jgi:hypothetical protein